MSFSGPDQIASLVHHFNVGLSCGLNVFLMVQMNLAYCISMIDGIIGLSAPYCPFIILM
jgi:hypothetical protein